MRAVRARRCALGQHVAVDEHEPCLQARRRQYILFLPLLLLLLLLASFLINALDLPLLTYPSFPLSWSFFTSLPPLSRR